MGRILRCIRPLEDQIDRLAEVENALQSVTHQHTLAVRRWHLNIQFLLRRLQQLGMPATGSGATELPLPDHEANNYINYLARWSRREAELHKQKDRLRARKRFELEKMRRMRARAVLTTLFAQEECRVQRTRSRQAIAVATGTTVELVPASPIPDVLMRALRPFQIVTRR